MFEVDWADPECERVGQRKERKKVEREAKKNDHSTRRSSHATTASSRTSTSSDRNHFGFFGTLGRKKSNTPSVASKERRSSASSNAKAASNDAANSPDVHPALRTSARAAAATPDNVPAIPEDESPVPLQPTQSKRSIDGSEPRVPETSDRSSQESMLSKTTQLTVPTLGSPSVAHPSAEAALATTVPVQTGKRQGPLQPVHMAEPQMTMQAIYTRREDGTFVPTGQYLGPILTASPTTPAPVKSHPVIQSPSPDDDESASELISYWFNALQTPSQRSPLPGSHSLSRRDHSLVPPSGYSVPATPTHRPTKRPPIPPRNPTRLKLRADNPDDWKTPEEWARLSAMRNRTGGSADGGVGKGEEGRNGQDSAELSNLRRQNDIRETTYRSPCERNRSGFSTSAPRTDAHPGERTGKETSPAVIYPETWI